MAHERLRPTFQFDEERLQQLRQIAPEAFADGKINWDTLRAALGDLEEEEGPDAEYFGLSWPGKRLARKITSIPSTGTLVPKYGEGLKADGTPDTDGNNDSRNIFIEGENLEVLKLFQKSYAGRIKMIYIDPPYNTGNDFIYDDNFTEPLQEYLRRTGQVDEEGKALTTNKRADGRFHSKWLSMMYPRLRLARNLLKEDGVIFVSIDDNEVHYLRGLLNETFGEENFIASLIWEKSKKGDAKFVSISHEYVLVFSKDIEALKQKGVWRIKKEGAEEVLEKYEAIKQEKNNNHEAIREAMMNWYRELDDDDSRKKHKHYNFSDDRGLYFAADFAGPNDGRKSRPRYEIQHPVTGKPCKKPSTGWRWEESKTFEALRESPPRIHFGADESTIPCRKSYLFEIATEPFSSVFYQDGRTATKEVDALIGKGAFDFPKNTGVLASFLEMIGDKDCIVLDFFGGSGSTAHAVLKQNQKDNGKRRFILVQMPELIDSGSSSGKLGFMNIADVTVARLKASIKEISTLDTNLRAGFKTFSLLHSNFKPWQNYHGQDPTEVENLFSQFEDPLREGWTEDGLTTEILLTEGFPLDSRMEIDPAYEANRVRRISSEFHAYQLLICLDEKVNSDTITHLDLRSNDVFICLDRAITDQEKLRLSDKGLLKTI